jgi:hypothetical protein
MAVPEELLEAPEVAEPGSACPPTTLPECFDELGTT